MTITLAGGPYDGIAVDHNDINLYARLVPAGRRKFILMPARDKWDIVRESGDKKQGGELICYELLGSPTHAARYDHNAQGLAAAQRDVQLGLVTPPPTPDWSKYLHFVYYRGELVQPTEGSSTLTDEKGRRWTYRQQPFEEIDNPIDEPPMRNDGAWQSGATTVQSMQEFVDQLTDIID